MTTGKPDRPHYRTILISAMISALAAAVFGWLAASFEMGQTLTLDTARIAQLQVDIRSLGDSTKRFPSREEFTALQKQELEHWSEEHDFFVRQDARTDDIIRENAQIVAMFEKTKVRSGAGELAGPGN